MRTTLNQKHVGELDLSRKRNRLVTAVFWIVTVALIWLLLANAGCSPRQVPYASGGAQPFSGVEQGSGGGRGESAAMLSQTEAAHLAADLANRECERLYGVAPFHDEDHEAMFHHGLYHWGHLDVLGRDGFSAEVSFTAEGFNPSVAVYYTVDSDSSSEDMFARSH